MALQGIPISEEQCIGDSLEVINNAFSTLDQRTFVPVGTVITVAGSGVSVPQGFFVCDGSRKNRSEYTVLYNWLTVNGTRFPFGPDVTAADDILFKLPDFNSSSTLTTPYSGLVTVCIKY